MKLQCIVYSLQWIYYGAQCTMDSGQWAISSIQYNVFSVHFTGDVRNVQCAVYGVQFTVFSDLCKHYVCTILSDNTVDIVQSAVCTMKHIV